MLYVDPETASKSYIANKIYCTVITLKIMSKDFVWIEATVLQVRSPVENTSLPVQVDCRLMQVIPRKLREFCLGYRYVARGTHDLHSQQTYCIINPLID